MVFTEAVTLACKGCKNCIATTLDILRKDRAELDLNPTYILDRNHDIH